MYIHIYIHIYISNLCDGRCVVWTNTAFVLSFSLSLSISFSLPLSCFLSLLSFSFSRTRTRARSLARSPCVPISFSISLSHSRSLFNSFLLLARAPRARARALTLSPVPAMELLKYITQNGRKTTKSDTNAYAPVRMLIPRTCSLSSKGTDSGASSWSRKKTTIEMSATRFEKIKR